MKIGIIIKREYFTRVRKRSFIILTILGPILFAALMLAPALIMEHSDDMNTKKTIAVLDETGMFKGKFDDTDVNTFLFQNQELDSLKNMVKTGIFDAVLYIPATSLNIPVNAKLYSQRQMPMTLTTHITTLMKNVVEHQKLLASGIDPAIVKASTADINVTTIRFSDLDDGKEKTSYAEFEFLLGMFLSIMIYFVIFLFGNQVLRGVIEEKSNRIIEVIISSVKPFELMMGKIIGLALVGLTQFLLWIVLTGFIYGIFTVVAGQPEIASSGSVMTEQISGAMTNTDKQELLNTVTDVVNSINISAILWSFLLYFIGGYLLYAAMFAAVGAAVDSETDSQQFVLPISIPLILGIVCSTAIANNPDGTLAMWLSMIPFTSPVAMMIRIPFGVPYWQIFISILILFISFVVITWMAAKIYRTGILMYGKKITWKEMWKWVRY